MVMPVIRSHWLVFKALHVLQGDSGGPMSVRRSDGRYNLAGIISWGIGCAKRNQPGVMTRIAYFRDWINTIIKF